MLGQAQFAVLHQAGTVGVQFPAGGRDGVAVGRLGEGLEHVRGVSS